MSKQYDATTKQMLEGHPADWLALAGLPAGGVVRVVDADVSAVTAAADKVVYVGGPHPYLAHFEFQVSADEDLDLRMLVYNVLLRRRHGLPVRSVVVLFRPQSQPRSVTGRVRDLTDPHAPLDFGYRLIRAWEQPVASILAGGVGTLPLVAVSAATPAELPAALEAVADRLGCEVSPGEADDLLAATFILAGLRRPPVRIEQLFEGVRKMEESTTYQWIIAKGMERGRNAGKAEGVRELLLRLGRKRFGAPPPAVAETLQVTTDVERLESLAERVMDVASWDELLESPRP